MTPSDFQIIAEFVKQRSGIHIAPDKQYLLESRLRPIARKWQLEGVDELAGVLRGQPSSEQETEIVEAMTTNESYFFRDEGPFQALREVMLPTLLAARQAQRRLRIWSAAASSGQEAYSIAMTLLDANLLGAGWSVEIVGTDINHEMIAKARAGSYNRFEIFRGLNAAQREKYFEPVGDHWVARESLRSLVSFRVANILDARNLGTFDIIFCRNVIIYFDIATKGKAFEVLANHIAPDGYLLLGAAENVTGLTRRFCPSPAPERYNYFVPTAVPR